MLIRVLPSYQFSILLLPLPTTPSFASEGLWVISHSSVARNEECPGVLAFRAPSEHPGKRSMALFHEDIKKYSELRGLHSFRLNSY